MNCLRLNPFLIDNEMSKSAILKLSFPSLKDQRPPLTQSYFLQPNMVKRSPTGGKPVQPGKLHSTTQTLNFTFTWKLFLSSCRTGMRACSVHCKSAFSESDVPYSALDEDSSKKYS
ncbi:hypothetical protein AMECASPLE_033234 [Ameca splendens]|uniref:Uncharacterized protein n=1 Tax=Ameca splendens TaxID=208324 RepID=A0ABV0Y6N4_9TELE